MDLMSFLFYVRQDWNALVVVSAQENTSTSTKCYSWNACSHVDTRYDVIFNLEVGWSLNRELTAMLTDRELWIWIAVVPHLNLMLVSVFKNGRQVERSVFDLNNVGNKIIKLKDLRYCSCCLRLDHYDTSFILYNRQIWILKYKANKANFWLVNFLCCHRRYLNKLPTFF